VDIGHPVRKERMLITLASKGSGSGGFMSAHVNTTLSQQE